MIFWKYLRRLATILVPKKAIMAIIVVGSLMQIYVHFPAAGMNAAQTWELQIHSALIRSLGDLRTEPPYKPRVHEPAEKCSFKIVAFFWALGKNSKILGIILLICKKQLIKWDSDKWSDYLKTFFMRAMIPFLLFFSFWKTV